LRYIIADGQGLSAVGFDKEFIEGKTIWEALPPETSAMLEPIYRNVLAGEAISWQMEYQSRVGYVHAVPVRNEQGEIYAGIMVVQDISEQQAALRERKKTEEALRQSEERFRRLIGQARDGIFMFNSEGWFVEVNQRACQDLGYSYEELLTLGLWDLDPTWFQERFTELFVQQTNPGADDTVEAVIRRKDGSTFPVEIRVCVLEWDQQQYMLALVRDITKRKREEQVQTGLISFLQESDERFQQMAENIRDVFWMGQVNPMQTLYVSPAYEVILGRSYQDLYEKPGAFLDAVHPEDLDLVIGALEQHLGGESSDLEHRILRPDGSVRWVHARGFPIRNQVGEVYRVTGIVEDITERKLAEVALQQAKENLEIRVIERTAALSIANEQLRQEIIERKQAELALAESQKQLELFFTQSIDGFFFMMLDEAIVWDEQVQREKALDYVFAHQRITKANDAMLTQYGATENQFIGLTPNDLFTRDRMLGRSLWEQLFDNGRLHLEMEARKLDGTPIWIEGNYICLYDEQGRIRGHFGVQRDVSDRKQAEAALRESEERYRSLVANIPGAVYRYRYDDWWTLEFVSDAIAEISGYQVAELIDSDRSLKKIIHPEDLSRLEWIARHALIFRRPCMLEYRIVCANGSIRWVSDKSQAKYGEDGEILWVDGAIFDITERKQSEQELRQFAERLRLVVQNMPIMLDAYDEEGNLIVWNRECEQVTGYKATEIVDNPKAMELLYPDPNYRQQVVQTRQKLQNNFRDRELDITCKDGAIKTISWSNISKQFAIPGWSAWGVGVDISDRKQAEAALRISEQRQAFLLRSVPVVLYTARTFGDFGATWMSGNVEHITGFPANCFVDKPHFWLSRLHSDDQALVFSELDKLTNGESSSGVEYRWKCADGSYRWFLDRMVLFRDKSGNPKEIIGSWFDITQRKQAEEEIRNALAKEKELNELKSRFITMASHEFRTPLSTILSSADLLEYYIQEGAMKKQPEHIQRIQTACLNMTQLLNDVLIIGKTEAGKVALQPLPLDLDKFCYDLVQELKLSANSKHNIIWERVSELDATSPIQNRLPCLDEKLLRHILSNLLSNAIKYSPNGGNVKLKLAYENSYAIFQIEDEGIGIPLEDWEHLFEPFHRAKNVGTISGTGLGLTIVKRSIELHDGQISLASEIGKGTTFTVMLPLYSNCSYP
jgi:PAS domain S-box-containing protein